MALSATLHTLLDSQQAATGIESFKFITALRVAGQSECSEVIFVLKQTIKGSPVPMVKLRALGILNRCVMSANQYVLAAVSDTLLGTLGKLARWKKGSGAERRGEDMFGRESLVSPETRLASADFLSTLLTSISQWARRYHRTPTGAPSPFLQFYDSLVRDGVIFPGEAKPLLRHSLTPSPDLDSIRRSMSLMEDLLVATNPDKRALARCAETLTRQSNKVQEAVSALTVDDIEEYLAVNDSIRDLLDRYEKVRRTRDDLVDTSAQAGLKSDYTQWQVREEISKVKEQVSTLTAENEQKEKAIQQMRAEFEGKLRALTQQQAQEVAVQSAIDRLTSLSREKDQRIQSLRQTLSQLQTENQELSQRLAQVATVTAPYCNVREFKSVWCQAKGLLVDSPAVRVYFQLTTDGCRGVIKLAIRNDSGGPMAGLGTQLRFQPGEGLKMEISKEMEERTVGSGETVERQVSVEVEGFFPGFPALVVACAQPTSLQVMAFLPLSVFLVLEPTHMDPGEVIALWTELDSSKVTQKFLSLHTGNSAPALADLLRKMGRMQVFTSAEMQVLSGKVVVSCAKRGKEVVLVKGKVEETGGSFTVESTSDRLRDCVKSVLSLAVISQFSQ